MRTGRANMAAVGFAPHKARVPGGGPGVSLWLRPSPLRMRRW